MMQDDGEPSDADPYRANTVWSVIRGGGRLLTKTFFGYRIRGLQHIPRRGGGLLLINHQSFLDPLLVGTVLDRPVSYLARRTLFEVRFLGWMLRNTYVIPLDREAVSPSSIKEAVRRMRQGFLVGIFPEGTRSHDGAIQPFQTGFVTLVRRSGVPVIPVGIAGAFECFPRGQRYPSLGKVRTVVGPPLEPAVMSLLDDRRNDEFVTIARQRVIDCHEEATRWRDER